MPERFSSIGSCNWMTQGCNHDGMTMQVPVALLSLRIEEQNDSFLTACLATDNHYAEVKKQWPGYTSLPVDKFGSAARIR
jgi:hypothetical protein